MKIYSGLLLSLLLSLSISACSTPDNSQPPAELTEIPDAEQFRRLWSFDSGEGAIRNFFDLQPLLLGDKIYTIDTEGLIHQIDAQKGRADWQYQSGLSAMAGLSGNRQSLIATSSEGQLVRFDFAGDSLELRWQTSLNSEIRSRAVLDDDLIVARTVDGKLTALDYHSADVLWSVSRRVPALSLTGNSHALVTDDLVISGFDNGKLVAFDRENGSTVWESTVGSPSGRTEIERLVDLDGQFILKDGVIYVSSFQGNLAAITANSGQVVWTRKFSSFQAMDADADAIYLTDDQSHVWAIDRRTGSAFWKQEVLNARKLTAPRLIDGRLVVADLEGYVHYLSKQDGKLLGRIQTNDKRYISQPLALQDTAIVIDNSGQLTALTPKK